MDVNVGSGSLDFWYHLSAVIYFFIVRGVRGNDPFEVIGYSSRVDDPAARGSLQSISSASMSAGEGI